MQKIRKTNERSIEISKFGRTKQKGESWKSDELFIRISILPKLEYIDITELISIYNLKPKHALNWMYESRKAVSCRK